MIDLPFLLLRNLTGEDMCSMLCSADDGRPSKRSNKSQFLLENVVRHLLCVWACGCVSVCTVRNYTERVRTCVCVCGSGGGVT